jgi:histone H3/H4
MYGVRRVTPGSDLLSTPKAPVSRLIKAIGPKVTAESKRVGASPRLICVAVILSSKTH